MTRRRQRVSRTTFLSSWTDADLVCLRRDLRADATLGGRLQARYGYSWLAAVYAVLGSRGATSTDRLFDDVA